MVVMITNENMNFIYLAVDVSGNRISRKLNASMIINKFPTHSLIMFTDYRLPCSSI